MTIDLFTQKCNEGNSIYLENPKLAEYPLAEVLRVTFTQPALLCEIPQKDYFSVGHSFLLLLDIMRKEKDWYLQSLSSLGFYFITKSIQIEETFSAFVDRLFILNLGARTFHKTIANAMQLDIPTYIDFEKIDKLPIAIKNLLLLEYCDFLHIHHHFKFEFTQIQDLINRKQVLDSWAINDFFEDISSNTNFVITANKIQNQIIKYIEKQINEQNIIFQ